MSMLHIPISEQRLWARFIHLWGHLMSRHMALQRKHTLPVQQSKVQLLCVGQRTQPPCCAVKWKQHTETPFSMWIMYNCVFCFSFHKVTLIANVFTLWQMVQELLFCCDGTQTTEWSACFFRHFLVTTLKVEVSLLGHMGHQTTCHRSSFVWVFVKNIVYEENVQSVRDIEMHYKCSNTKYCWTCWTALGRRLNGILMPAKQQNVNTWSCVKYDCELGKISDHSNQCSQVYFHTLPVLCDSTYAEVM